MQQELIYVVQVYNVENSTWDIPSYRQQIAKGKQNGKFDGFGKDDHRLPKKQKL